MDYDELREAITKRQERITVPLTIAVVVGGVALFARWPAAHPLLLIVGGAFLAVAIQAVAARFIRFRCPHCERSWSYREQQYAVKHGQCCHCHTNFPVREPAPVASTAPIVERHALPPEEQLVVASAVEERAPVPLGDNPYAASLPDAPASELPEFYPLYVAKNLYAVTFGRFLPRRREAFEATSHCGFFGNERDGYRLSTTACEDRAHARRRLLYVPAHFLLPLAITFAAGPGHRLLYDEGSLIALPWLETIFCWLSVIVVCHIVLNSGLINQFWLRGSPEPLAGVPNAQGLSHLAFLLQGVTFNQLPILNLYYVLSQPSGVAVQLIQHETGALFELRLPEEPADAWHPLALNLRLLVGDVEAGFLADELRLVALNPDAKLAVSMFELRPR
jgi:hypothetical protein